MTSSVHKRMVPWIYVRAHRSTSVDGSVDRIARQLRAGDRRTDAPSGFVRPSGDGCRRRRRGIVHAGNQRHVCVRRRPRSRHEVLRGLRCADASAGTFRRMFAVHDRACARQHRHGQRRTCGASARGSGRNRRCGQRERCARPRHGESWPEWRDERRRGRECAKRRFGSQRRQQPSRRGRRKQQPTRCIGWNRRDLEHVWKRRTGRQLGWQRRLVVGPRRPEPALRLQSPVPQNRRSAMLRPRR